MKYYGITVIKQQGEHSLIIIPAIMAEPVKCNDDAEPQGYIVQNHVLMCITHHDKLLVNFFIETS